MSSRYRSLLNKVVLEDFPIRLYEVMCVDTLLLKFNSDEKQFTRLFISVFASDCILRPTNGGRPLWWWVGLACTDRNDHQPPESYYVSDTVLLAMNDTHVIRVVYSFCIISKWLNVMLMFRAQLFICGYSGQQCCIKDVSSISILK